MALEMKRGKDHVRFEWSDGVVESTVTLLPEDDQETLVRKLKRLVSLIEGEQALEPLDRLKRLAQEEAAAGVQKGFPKPFEPPAIPDHLKGEVELEEPVAPGNGWAAKGAGE